MESDAKSAAVAFPPSPREIRLRIGSGALLTGRWFILPHVLVGIAIFLIGALEMATLGFGISSQAIVTGHRITHSTKGGTTYHVDYVYNGGKTDHQQVSSIEFQTLKAGANLTVKSMSIAGHSFSVMVAPLAPTLRTLGFLEFFNLFWNGIMFIFVRALFLLPFRRKWLFRHGEIAIGTVDGKDALPGQKGKIYTVKYRYQTEDGTPYPGETPASGADYQRIVAGQNLIVFYNALKPQQSVAYELGDYVALDANGLEIPGIERNTTIA